MLELMVELLWVRCIEVQVMIVLDPSVAGISLKLLDQMIMQLEQAMAQSCKGE